MKACLATALCLTLLAAAAAPSDARARIAPQDVAPTGQPNADYRDATAWRGLQTEVIYLRPGAELDPSGDLRVEVPEPAQPVDTETRRWVWGLIFGALLVFVLVVVAYYGNAISVSFGARPRDRGRGAGDDAPADAHAAAMRQPLDEFLERLRGMSDRRQALILLVGRALERAAAANDLRLARAQTARDVVRTVPRGWPHHDTLRRLVREVEVVHFGGRDLSEERWQECFEAARPILRHGAAA